MPINSFIHAVGSCVWPSGKMCHRVSMKFPEELHFLEMISHLLGAIAFDDVNSIFRTWTDLGSAVLLWILMSLIFLLCIFFDKKIVLNMSMWCVICPQRKQPSLFFYVPRQFTTPTPGKVFWRKTVLSTAKYQAYSYYVHFINEEMIQGSLVMPLRSKN